MSVQTGDIYWVRLPFGESEDARPCVVLAADNQEVKVVRLSSATDLFNPNIHFMLDINHPNFDATGLRRKCYCDGSKIFNVKSIRLGKFIGRLDAELAREFNAWIG